jgi:hypothetical protein
MLYLQVTNDKMARASPTIDKSQTKGFKGLSSSSTPADNLITYFEGMSKEASVVWRRVS